MRFPRWRVGLICSSMRNFLAGVIPTVIKRQIILMRQNLNGMQGVLTLVRRLAEEIDVLNPSVRRDGRRPDNCEYPWEAGGQVVSPLDWSFHPLRLCNVPAGRTFIKLLREAIDRIIDELEH